MSPVVRALGWVALSATLFCGSAGMVWAAPSAAMKSVRSIEGIEEYTLPNGLQVLLARDDSKPSTTVNLTVRVGSRHENYGETGMAHLLEHLLFKGSAKHPQPWGEFTKRGLRPTARPGWTGPTISPASPRMTTTCVGIWIGWLMPWSTASLPAKTWTPK